MKSLFLRWGALFLAFVCLFSFASGASAQSHLGGFTPNPEVSLTFEKTEYAPGSSPEATVMITGPKSASGKKYRVSISNKASGDEITFIELIIGGAPGSNEGTVNVQLPNTEGEVTIVASFSIGDKAATPDEEKLTLKIPEASLVLESAPDSIVAGGGKATVTATYNSSTAKAGHTVAFS